MSVLHSWKSLHTPTLFREVSRNLLAHTPQKETEGSSTSVPSPASIRYLMGTTHTAFCIEGCRGLRDLGLRVHTASDLGVLTRNPTCQTGSERWGHGESPLLLWPGCCGEWSGRGRGRALGAAVPLSPLPWALLLSGVRADHLAGRRAAPPRAARRGPAHPAPGHAPSLGSRDSPARWAP